jgi:AcrR family transcriptional regulator
MSPRRARAVQNHEGSDPADALREHLIATADRLVAEGRVSSLTTRQIARAAGVSDGVLYNYFSSKNDLLVTAVVRRYASLVTRFETQLPVAGTQPVEANLSQLIRALHDLLGQTLPIARGLLSEPDLLSRFIEEIHRQPLGAGRLVDPISRLVESEQEHGRIDSSVPGEAAMTLILGSALNLALAQAMGGVSDDEVTQVIPQLADLLMHGLGPR